MKIIIEQSELNKALTHVQSVVEKRNTIPILSNVKIEGKGKTLFLNATDMDLHFIETINATVTQPGATTISALTLYDIVKKIPEGSQISIEQDEDEGIVTLRSGRSKFSLASLSVDSFPSLINDDFSHSFTVSTNDMKALLDHTKFAISLEETRHYLTGIYFHSVQSNNVSVLRTVATDGHRLARFEVPLPPGAEEIPGIIIPFKTVNELRKLLDEVSTEVSVSLSETRICFKLGNAVMTSKLIDGVFPDYERVIPSKNDQILDIDCQSLYNAVDRVSVVTSEKSRAIKLNLSEKNLELSASSPGSGSALEELEASYEGTLIETGFNSRYLLEVLKQIECDVVRLAFSSGGGPVLIQEVASNNAIYVLMPMRV
jgi:DNA polymerase-3 subunit beta